MIKYSAVLFFDENNYPVIMTGLRHADIFEKMFKHKIKYDKNKAIQGFITDKNQFLDRYEAKKEAENNNQIIEKTNLVELFSEDIWPE